MYPIPGPEQVEAADLTAMHDHLRQRSLSAHKILAKSIWQAMYGLGAGLRPGMRWMAFGLDADIFGSPAPQPTGSPDDTINALTGQIPLVPRWPLHDESARPLDDVGPGENLSVDVAIVNSLFNDVDLHAPQRKADRAARDTAAILASVASTRQGGVTAALVSDDWLDLPHAALRERVDREAGAVRLPAGALRPGAGTDRPVDLLLLRRRASDVEPPGGDPFMSVYPGLLAAPRTMYEFSERSNDFGALTSFSAPKER